MATQVIAYVPGTGRAKADLTSWAGDAFFPVTPVATDQIEYPTGLTVGADGAITGDAGTYTIRLVDASTGTVYGLSYEIAGEGGGGGEPGTGTTSFTFTPPDGHAFATLAEGFDTYLFQDWTPGTPAVGWQIVYPTISNTQINNLGELQTDSEIVLDAWAVNLTGQWYGFTITPETGVYEPAAPAETPVIGSPTVGSSTASIPFTWAGYAVTFEYRLNGGAWGDTPNPIVLAGLLPETLYTVEVRGYNELGAGPTASTQITTTAAPEQPAEEASSTAISRPRIKIMGKAA